MAFLLHFMLKIKKDEEEERNLSKILIGSQETFYLVAKHACVFFCFAYLCVCVLTSPKANFLPLSILLQGISL